MKKWIGVFLFLISPVALAQLYAPEGTWADLTRLLSVSSGIVDSVDRCANVEAKLKAIQNERSASQLATDLGVPTVNITDANLTVQACKELVDYLDADLGGATRVNTRRKRLNLYQR